MGVTLGTSLGNFRVPTDIHTHEDFLRWQAETEIPEELRVGFINGQVWVDAMAERAFTHNGIKTAIAVVVGSIVEQGSLGVYFGDGMLFTSMGEKFSVYPDGMFVSHESIEQKRVWLDGAKPGEVDTRLQGAPDLTVEVVSDSSEDKDTEWQMSRYWNAGVREYWVVDARAEPLRFTIFRRTGKGFAPVRKSGGWAKSSVLGRSFRFVPGEKVFGKRTYRFEATPPVR